MRFKSKLVQAIPYLLTLLIYIVFFWGYWKLPIVIFDEPHDMDVFRYWYIRGFALIMLLVSLLFRKWFASIVLVLISSTLKFHRLLMPLVNNFRLSCDFLPNSLSSSWGFTIIFILLFEKLNHKIIDPRKTCLIFFVIYWLQLLINPVSFLLYFGPR